MNQLFYDEVINNNNNNNSNGNNEKSRPMSICWRNICFETSNSTKTTTMVEEKKLKGNDNVTNETPQSITSPKKSNSKIILHRLDGYFECNTLNGLMGPSGAGKTTFLNCLGGNVRFGVNNSKMINCVNKWEIYVNTNPSIDTKSLKKISHTSQSSSCWIEQHVQNSILGQLKVGEILRYAYGFKNNCNSKDVKNYHTSSMEEYIYEILQDFMLDKQMLHRRFDQCSGGEQKRIVIAQELMCRLKPEFLFVDEPTTGLDSNAALVVMTCLKKLASTYRMTVIVSIHFPNDEIINLFDKLYVLAKGGVCIYSGKPETLSVYLQNLYHLTNVNNNVDNALAIVPNDEKTRQNQQNQRPIEALIKLACNGQ